MDTSPPTGLKTPNMVQAARTLRTEFATTAQGLDSRAEDAAENLRRIWEEDLFRLNVPREFGGVAGDRIISRWLELIETLTQLSAGEGGTGMNFAVQSLVTREIFYAGRGQLLDDTLRFMAAEILERGARVVASNAETGVGGRVRGRRVTGGIIVDGTKSFNTNSGGGGWANVGLALEGVDQGTHHALISLDSEGVQVHGTWDNMGQRSTFSQTITYRNVFVRDGWHYHVDQLDAALIPGVFLMHSSINLGIGLGALDAALDFVRTQHRTLTPGIKDPAQDPLVTRHVGTWSTNLTAAHALQTSVARQVEDFEGSREEVVPLFIDSFKAKVAAINSSLEVATGLFDLTGARSTSSAHGLDRFWRNARTFATHDPIDQKLIWIGAYDLAHMEPPLMAVLRV